MEPPRLTLVREAYPSIWRLVAGLASCQAVVPVFWFSVAVGFDPPDWAFAISGTQPMAAAPAPAAAIRSNSRRLSRSFFLLDIMLLQAHPLPPQIALCADCVP